jgi:antibiotic biosynthesis monooxygenase (ABM) superfamily enzyme
VVAGLEVDRMTHGVARVERAREPAGLEAWVKAERRERRPEARWREDIVVECVCVEGSS